LLLLLGLAGDRSEATFSMLTSVLSAHDLVQRRGAALAFAHLKPDPLPDLARAAILDAIAANDLEGSFHGLPWDDVVGAEFDKKNSMRASIQHPAKRWPWAVSWASSPATRRIKLFLPS
jgi:hypothetical protein